jgi:hypothetical protein
VNIQNTASKIRYEKILYQVKNPEHIPYDLIGEPVKKVSVKDWINTYESQVKR